MAIDLEAVRHALAIARQRNYGSVDLETADMQFSAETGRAAPSAKPRAAEGGAAGAEVEAWIVRSTFVGFFGAAEPPVEVGDAVGEEDVVGIVSVLGIANEVVAGQSGVVETVFASDGDPVEYGQALIKVKPE